MTFKTNKKSQQGSIIVFSIIIMTILLTITLTLVQVVIPKIKTINEAVNSVYAVFAADTAMEWCIYTNRAKLWVAPPELTNTATYEIYGSVSGQPEIDTANNAFCEGDKLNFRTLGTYGGVTRSFEVTQIE